jgi:hypothetical protein
MKRRSILTKTVLLTAALLGTTTGCSNSSGSLGKGRLSILNVVSLEGEGITWDNRVPAPAAAATTPQE